MSYSATGLPLGLSIAATTGLISGTPTTPGSYNVTATVSDGNLSDSEAFTWTITPDTGGGPTQTLFTTQTPSSININDGVSYELGMKFQATVDGQITAIRYWRDADETGSHTGNIWSATGTLLASVDFTGETASGWQQQALTAPLTINANTTYVVSVNINSRYVATPQGLASAIVNANLRSVADNDNGVFNTTPGEFPEGSFNNTN